MPPATSFREARAFAGQISRVAGTIPEPLQHLVDAADLFGAQRAAQSPVDGIVAQAVDGKLTAKRLDELIAARAAEHSAALIRVELRERAERLLIDAWHKALRDGAADTVLNSMRGQFDEHAQALAHARSLISPDDSAEAVIASGQPELVTAWQSIDKHLAVIGRIAAVAAQFGCNGAYPQISIYANSDSSFRINDLALMCTDGPLERDSALFGRPDQGHRSSPWFRLQLKLQSVDGAAARYRDWCADVWDAQNAGDPGGYIIDGKMVSRPRQKNPLRTANA